MKKVIVHAPHASTYVPSYAGYVSKAIVQQEINQLTDWFTDELFNAPNCQVIAAPFSRVFCDVERFENDAQEPMAAQGMGATYTLTDGLQQLRHLPTAQREVIIQNYYWPHHNALSQAVANQLLAYDKALIVDAHSFPSTPLNRDLNKVTPRPQINIGTDPYHTPAALTQKVVRYFTQLGYTVTVDWPYAGALVPMAYYQKNKNVQSIMIEINRDEYLDAATFQKSAQFNQVQAHIHILLQQLQAV